MRATLLSWADEQPYQEAPLRELLPLGDIVAHYERAAGDTRLLRCTYHVRRA